MTSDIDVDALAERVRPVVERFVAEQLEAVEREQAWPLTWNTVHDQQQGLTELLVGLTSVRVDDATDQVTAPTRDTGETPPEQG